MQHLNLLSQSWIFNVRAEPNCRHFNWRNISTVGQLISVLITCCTACVLPYDWLLKFEFIICFNLACKFSNFICLIIHLIVIAFSALILFVGRQEQHMACKNWAMRCWCGHLSGARCRLFAYGPADATAIPKTISSVASFKSKPVLPFWYCFTRVVLEMRPINRCNIHLIVILCSDSVTLSIVPRGTHQCTISCFTVVFHHCGWCQVSLSRALITPSPTQHHQQQHHHSRRHHRPHPALTMCHWPSSFCLSTADHLNCMHWDTCWQLCTSSMPGRRSSFMRHLKKTYADRINTKYAAEIWGIVAQNCLKPTTPSRSTGVQTQRWWHSVGNQVVKITKRNRNR